MVQDFLIQSIYLIIQLTRGFISKSGQDQFKWQVIGYRWRRWIPPSVAVPNAETIEGLKSP
jgi:hypothetical protein